MSQNVLEIIWKGIAKQNPVFKMVLGLCPVLAVTTALSNGIVMGLATTFVLICSNFIISLLAKYIPPKIRIPCYIVIIATFVTIVDMLLNGFVPLIHKTLGIYVPLIVVNCIILGRAESFASKNSVFFSIVDGLSMGAGFTLSLCLISIIREFFGTGALYLFDIKLLSITSLHPLMLFVLAPGAFLSIGLLLGLFNYFGIMRKRRCNT